MTAVHLRRVDPARNMHRFYRLDVQSDLFGGVSHSGLACVRLPSLLSIPGMGTHRRARAHGGRAYDSEALAADALQRHTERKRRRGYT